MATVEKGRRLRMFNQAAGFTHSVNRLILSFLHEPLEHEVPKWLKQALQEYLLNRSQALLTSGCFTSVHSRSMIQ